MKEYSDRKSTRFSDYDYNTCGGYFLTVCTKDRKNILSNIVGDGVLDVPRVDFWDSARVELKKYGLIVERIINQLDDFYENVSVDRYVIMPNHIHIVPFLRESGQSGTPVPTSQNSVVSRFISTLKRFCNKEIGENIFQRSYYDHVLRDKEDYEKHIKYIAENPMRWFFDELYPDNYDGLIMEVE